MGAAAAEQKKAEGALARAEEAVRRLGEEIAALKASISKAQEQYLGQLPEALGAKLRALQEAAQKTSEERVQVNGELESVRASLAALVANLEGRQQELDGAKTSVAAKKKEIAQTEKSVVAAKESLDALKSVESKQSETQKAQAEKKRGFEEERLVVTRKLGEAQANLETRRSMLTQEETRLAVAESKFHELEEALKQYPEPEPDEKPMSVEDLKRKIATLEQQLAALGDVNLRAVEEYDAEKGRLDEFGTEVQRLTAEKTELVGLVQEIEKKKREKINEVVVQVNGNFRAIYGELSAGGEGEIALEDPADPPVRGLLIDARPVGHAVARLDGL